MSLTATTRVERDPGKGPEALRFHVRGETETFTFCASSMEDMEAWMRCIVAIVPSESMDQLLGRLRHSTMTT
jgi:hypothetical protein